MPRSPDYSETTDEAERPPALKPGQPITPVLNPNEARQGVTHHNVLIILAVSLLAVVVAMVIAWSLFFPTPGGQTTLPQDPATLPEPAPQTDAQP